jgi:UDP-glucose 4-epimerase
MNLTGKNILVIGGAGLIGSHTVDKLLNENIGTIVIYDNFARGNYGNLESALRDPRVKVYDIGGDILQTDILESAIINEKIDAIFHFAALWLLQCHEYPRAAFNTNVAGTFNVIEACVKNNIKRLVWSSSASVYGDAISNPMDEEHPYKNKNFYGATKICGEAMLHSFYHRYGLNYVGLRYMNVYGPRQDYKGAYIAVIMKMLDAIDKGENPQIFGDGSESFDFVAVEDCAKSNVLAMKATTVDQFYNVGTGTSTSLRELAETLLFLTDSDLEIKYVTTKQNTLVKSRIGCPKKALHEIGFKSEIDLKEGLSRLIEWRRIHKQSNIKFKGLE